MIGIIAAMSAHGVIGRDGEIPWKYPGDMKHFKERTSGSTVILGRKTWVSMWSRILPNRKMVVITSNPSLLTRDPRIEHPGFFFAESFSQALQCAMLGPKPPDIGDDVWVIGGERVYRDALPFADVIDLSLVPDDVKPTKGPGWYYKDAMFPTLDPSNWFIDKVQPHPHEPELINFLIKPKCQEDFSHLVDTV